MNTKTCDPVELAQTLVRMNTVNRPGNEEPCARHVADLLAAAGFECRFSEFGPGRTSVMAKLGGRPGERPLVFTGHLDVVPLGAAAWTHDPFAAEIVDGKLYGRGASDMKGGVAAFVSAAVAHADELRDSPGLVLAITAGEETGCEGARHLIAANDVQAMVGPLGAGALLVGEPTSNRPLAGHKGVIWLRASAHGVTAHGSMPERGDNAIYKLIPGVTTLRDFDFAQPGPHPFMGRPTLNVGLIEGGLNINSVPDRASFSADLRTVPGIDHAALIERVRQQLGTDMALEVLLNLACVYTDPEDPWIRFLCDLCADGQAPGSVSYFSDASVLRGALGNPPTAILGPGEPGMAHQTDEYCLVQRINEAQVFYGRIISDWCQRGAMARD